MAELLQARNLSVEFPLQSAILRRTVGYVRALDDVSFSLGEGETLGVVGESGCGKSTMGRAIAGLVPISGGDVRLRGEDMRDSRGRVARWARRQVQMIFQDPYASLNPRRTALGLITEPWEVHNDVVPRAEMRARAAELFELVGLDHSQIDRYPHQFSGGQQQRIAIARALALQPELLVCDESVSALDVSIQGQVLQLLQRLQAELGLSYLFISHDLAVIRIIAKSVIVMYLGRVMEIGATSEVLASPAHPYTQALLASVPIPDPDRARKRERIVLEGDVPSPTAPPSGCVFRTRCPIAEERCAHEIPPLLAIGSGRASACHFPDAQILHSRKP